MKKKVLKIHSNTKGKIQYTSTIRLYGYTSTNPYITTQLSGKCLNASKQYSRKHIYAY